MGWVRLAIAVLVGISMVGCQRNPRANRPNVVLIVVDTLRADHLGAYGYDQPTTPRLNGLAAEGVRFATARATSSWTLPSVASLFTAQYPAAHGVERNTDALPADAATMAEAFRDAGYLTAAFSANPAFVTPLQGFAQGFDEFTVKHGAPVTAAARGNTTPSDPWLRSKVEVSAADEISASALAWVAGFDSAPAPYFLYVHYFDPHAGYFPPVAYATRFGVAEDDPLRGEAQWALLLARKAPENKQDTATLRKLYDAEVAFTDDEIGVLVDGIRARARRPTLFVVLADHGEEFDDHGGLQHGRTLYEELLRVPWIMTGPGMPAGRVVEEPVSLVCLWPTLAELTGTAPPPTPGGPSLVNAIAGKPIEMLTSFADLDSRFPGDRLRHRRAVIESKWKMVTGPVGGSDLFDLRTDPQERFTSDDDVQAKLKAQLRVHDASGRTARAARPPAKIEMTRERNERLKALGYLQ